MLRHKDIKKEVKQVANLQLVKETNLNLIFNLINRYEPVSRARLARMTKLSPTTVSSLTEELLRNSMVLETGTGMTSAIGRKPIMLEVNMYGGYVIAIEMVEDGFICFLYNLKCREVDGSHTAVNNYETIGTEIIRSIDTMLEKNDVAEERLLGICIGVPGLIDARNKRVISSTVIPIKESNNFLDMVRDRFEEAAVFLGNESCFTAYAEKEFGVDGNVKNLVSIDINIGIGAGIIIDGRIFTGSFGLAGEIGHISIDMNGPRCKCGNRGCLEIMSGIPAMSQKIISGMMSGRDTVIREITGNDPNRIDADVIGKAVELKDSLVLEIVGEIVLKLAFGINNIINLLNPEVIVISGDIIKLGDFFLEKLRHDIRTIGLQPDTGVANVVFSSLKGNTVTLGAAKFMLDNLFNTASVFNSNILGIQDR